MKTLDRYILKKFIFTFLFILLLIVAIIMLLDLTEKNEDFIKHQLSYQEILAYYRAFLPFMTNLVMPITVFITTVFVTSRLAQRTEVIAILSGGISFLRFLVPYFIGATLITLFSFVLTGWILADANKTRVAFETAYIDNPLRSSSDHLHIKLAPDTYLYVGRYRSYNGVGTEVTLETISHNQLLTKLSAKQMQWIEETGKWRFSDWMHRKIDGLAEHISQGSVLDTTLNLHPDDFVINPKLHETLTLPELSTHIQKLKDKGAANVHVFLTEKYVRYMSPFAAIILTFMGVVVSARKARGGVGLQIALGFVLALVYIALFLFAKGTAEVKGKQLLLTIWMPNLTFSMISCFLYRLMPK
mgnify:CR=1 FL=1